MWVWARVQLNLVKYSYPPKPLPASGLLSSIPITRGEQIIVTSLDPKPAVDSPAVAPPIKARNEALSAPSPHSARATTPVVPGEPVVEGGAESVPLPGRDAGYLQLRVVADDNSCMFAALGVVFEGGVEAASKLRQVAADEIRRDPESWSDVVLG